MNLLTVVPIHVDIIAFWRRSQLTETSTGSKYLQIESQWTVLPIIL
jgi:hypothetical protein